MALPAAPGGSRGGSGKGGEHRVVSVSGLVVLPALAEFMFLWEEARGWSAVERGFWLRCFGELGRPGSSPSDLAAALAPADDSGLAWGAGRWDLEQGRRGYFWKVELCVVFRAG